MMVGFLFLVVLGVIALVAAADNANRAQRRAEALPRPAQVPSLPDPTVRGAGGLDALMLRLPEPARTRAWTLLCTVVDAQVSAGPSDGRTAFLLAQTRDAYLPDTLRAYLNLTDGARQVLAAQGQPADVLLAEQLGLMEDGVREALRHDHATADRLLTQGRFLRERFGPADPALRLDRRPG